MKNRAADKAEPVTPKYAVRLHMHNGHTFIGEPADFDIATATKSQIFDQLVTDFRPWITFGRLTVLKSEIVGLEVVKK